MIYLLQKPERKKRTPPLIVERKQKKLGAEFKCGVMASCFFSRSKGNNKGRISGTRNHRIDEPGRGRADLGQWISGVKSAEVAEVELGLASNGRDACTARSWEEGGDAQCRGGDS